jgi:hypothetical protein
MEVGFLFYSTYLLPKANTMSKENFETAVGRAVLDDGFRHLLLADPDQALSHFELTEQEAYIIRNIDSETLEAMSLMLEARLRTIRQAEAAVKPKAPVQPDSQ